MADDKVSELMDQLAKSVDAAKEARKRHPNFVTRAHPRTYDTPVPADGKGVQGLHPIHAVLDEVEPEVFEPEVFEESDTYVEELEALIIRLYEVRGQRISREKWLNNFTADQRKILNHILGWRLTWVRRGQ